ncbi:DUF2730 family protein [Xanthobacter sp.]|uniref:DUF2730 family protein n=1 Tax=Xanthobacter sp. TaxID=35809 RepID=UPI0025FB3598|nr:DUF2730 family protein [Xanthobacter sp.]
MIEFPHLMMVIMALLSFASIATTIVMTRGKAAADKVSALEAKLADRASDGRVGTLELRVDKVENRTTAIESELRHLPSRDQTHAMEVALTEMKGQLAVVAEKVGVSTSINQRLQEFLLEEARSKRELA